MKRLIAICAVCLFAHAAGAQDRVQILPFDEGPRDAAFDTYRAALLQAVITRDIDAVVQATSPKITLSFGGDGGRQQLRDNLTVSPETVSEDYRHLAPEMREEYWAELEAVLRLGGKFQDDGAGFAAPYTFVADLPDSAASIDAFKLYFVIASGVALRDRPIRYGTQLTRLDHDVVTLLDGGQGTQYRRIKLGDGTTGYAHQEYLRANVGYRAYFALENGQWQMTMFLAGD